MSLPKMIFRINSVFIIWSCKLSRTKILKGQKPPDCWSIFYFSIIPVLYTSAMFSTISSNSSSGFSNFIRSFGILVFNYKTPAWHFLSHNSDKTEKNSLLYWHLPWTDERIFQLFHCFPCRKILMFNLLNCLLHIFWCRIFRLRKICCHIWNCFMVIIH